MPNLNANEYFADWYRNADPNITAEKINFRTTVISTLVKKNGTTYWASIIKIYLGTLKERDFIDAFALEFKNADATFPMVKNENVLQILAGITICFKLERTKSAINDFIAVALLNCNFFGKQKHINKVSVLDFANNYLLANTPKGRESVNEGLSRIAFGDAKTAISENEEFDKENILKIVSIVGELIERNNALSEETNVLWWTISEQSIIAEKPFNQIGELATTLLAAKELSSLTIFEHALPSAECILLKNIYVANNHKMPKQHSIFEILSSIEQKYADVLLENYDQKYSDFLPLLAVIQKAFSSSDMKENINNVIKGDKKYSLEKISNQLYNEFILLKEL